METLKKIFEVFVAALLIGVLTLALGFGMFALTFLTENSTTIDTKVTANVHESQIINLDHPADLVFGNCDDKKFIISDQHGNMFAAEPVDNVPLGVEGPCWTLSMSDYQGQILMAKGSAKIIAVSDSPVTVHVYYPRETASHMFWSTIWIIYVIVLLICGLMYVTQR